MKHPIIRTIYLYLFALVGLALLASGTYSFIDLGLRAYVFTAADQDYRSAPIAPSLVKTDDVARVEAIKSCEDQCELTEEQIQQIDAWLIDYQTWQEQDAKIDYAKSNRQRQASSALARIIVGLPLYLYHWTVIKRDVRKRKEQK